VLLPFVKLVMLSCLFRFWGMAKTRLVKFKGMSRSTFNSHLKECEWRFNHRDEDLYRLLLKITRSAIAI
jgi:transposase-like protein